LRIYPFFIPHQGCPHHCLFCQQNRIAGVVRAPAPSEVFSALQSDLPDWGEGEVAFFGGTFTLLPLELQKDYLRQVEPFIRARRVSGIRISTRPDALDVEKVALLRDCGVTTVELGCQSFSADVLTLSERGHGPEAADLAVGLLRDKGFQIGLQLMPGLPGGNRQEAFFSLRRALDLGPDFIRLYPAVVLKDTGLERAWRNGDFQPLTLEKAVDLCADLLLLCRSARVPVIRVGLQATEELDRGDSLMAGPYHPAFGQLVRSRLWRRALERELSRDVAVSVLVNPADLSDALGHRRENLRYLQRKYPGFSVQGHESVLRDRFRLGDRCLSLD
jgi:histone acetyltransferase (RNA polymerase elongator complex component)